MDTPEQPELIAIVLGALSEQVYSYEDETGRQFHWSVNAGFAFAQARNELHMVSLKEMGVTFEAVRDMNPGVNSLYALTTDLTRPLLFVPIGDKVRLIDGWNRVTKALLLGVDALPAYFLTQEEADACLILTLPPGRGIDWGQKGTTQASTTDGERSQRRS